MMPPFLKRGMMDVVEITYMDPGRTAADISRKPVAVRRRHGMTLHLPLLAAPSLSSGLSIKILYTVETRP